MSQQWFFLRGGERFGPVSGEQLLALDGCGQLAPGDPVWTEGMAEWLPASSVPGLIFRIPPQPSARPMYQPVAAAAPQAEPPDDLAAAAATAIGRRPARMRLPQRNNSKAIVGVGAVVLSVIIGILVYSFGGSSRASGETLQGFRDKLRAVALRKGSQTGHGMIVRKQDLIKTFGEPMRVQQLDGDEIYIYYAISDGLLQIESVGSYWNGVQKYDYLESDPPPHPLVQQLGQGVPKTVEGWLDTSSAQYRDRVAKWYLQTHRNPYAVVGPDESTGWYHLEENGQYCYVEVQNQRERVGFEQAMTSMLVTKAQSLVDAEVEKYKNDWIRQHTKRVNEPVMIVQGMRVH